MCEALVQQALRPILAAQQHATQDVPALQQLPVAEGVKQQQAAQLGQGLEVVALPAEGRWGGVCV